MYLHLVEGHVPTEMRRLRYLSFADEGSLKRYRHLIKEMRRLFAPGDNAITQFWQVRTLMVVGGWLSPSVRL